MQKAYAKTIKGKSGDYASDETTTHSRIDDRNDSIVSRFKEFKCLSDQVANSKYYSVNWYYPGGKRAFPFEPDMWRVTKFYMYATGGRICIDIAHDDKEKAKMERKASFVKQSGLRYICITHAMKYEEIAVELTRALT